MPEGTTRIELLQRALLTGGGVAVGGLVIAALPDFAGSKPSPAQDAEILNFALLLEYVQAGVLRRSDPARRPDRASCKHVRGDGPRPRARAHRVHPEGARRGGPQAAEARLRRRHRRPPRSSADAALKLEDLGVAAYNAQAPNLTQGALAAAARIVSVEARHAAWIRAIARASCPRPNASEPTTSAERVDATPSRGAGTCDERALTLGDIDATARSPRRSTRLHGRRARRSCAAPCSASAALLARGRRAGRRPRPRTRDEAILNYALTLEYLQDAFYSEAERIGAPHGRAGRAGARGRAPHERAHVMALREVLGAQAVKRPRFDFRGATEDAERVPQDRRRVRGPRGRRLQGPGAADPGRALLVRGARDPLRRGAARRLDPAPRRRHARAPTRSTSRRSKAARSDRRRHPLRRGAARRKPRARPNSRVSGAARRGRRRRWRAVSRASRSRSLLGRGESPATPRARRAAVRGCRRRRAAALRIGPPVAAAPHPARRRALVRPRAARRHARAGARRAPRAAVGRPARRADARGHDEHRRSSLGRAGATRAARLWVRVRLPVLPNGTTGWVPRSALGRLRDRAHAADRRPRAPARDAPARRPRACCARRSASARAARPRRAGDFVVRNRLTRYRSRVLRPDRVRHQRPLGDADRLAGRRLRRHPRHRPPGPDPRRACRTAASACATPTSCGSRA